MRALFFIFVLCWANVGSAQTQTEWHVIPSTQANNMATTNVSEGDGTFERPWYLQYALNNPENLIKGGHKLYLHSDQTANNYKYKGRFTSTLSSGNLSSYIQVMSYPGEWAILDGNITSTIPQVLNITGSMVSYENFEITCTGTFNRVYKVKKGSNPEQPCLPNDFQGVQGIEHRFNKNRFVNLVVHNNPSSGIGSWKHTSDSEIYGCIIYNNGYIRKEMVNCSAANNEDKNLGKGYGVYTQNENDTLKRLFRNNILMNNYDSGIGVWSEDEDPADNFLKNVMISQNIFLNNGGPNRDETPNLKVMSNTQTTVNYSSGIEVEKNIMYFNSRGSNISGIEVTKSNGIKIHDNHIFKGTAGVVFRETVSNLEFHHNFYWGKYMQYYITAANYLSKNWSIHDNTYFKRTGAGDSPTLNFQVPNLTFDPEEDETAIGGSNPMYTRIELNTFKSPNTALTYKYGGENSTTSQGIIDSGSETGTYNNVLGFNGISTPGDFSYRTFITRNKYNPNIFHVVIFDAVSMADTINKTINVDFSEYGIPADRRFKIRDAENYHTLLTTPTDALVSNQIAFPMYLTGFEMPLGTVGTDYYEIGPDPGHTQRDLRVFIVEFVCPNLPYDKSINRTDNTNLTGTPDLAKNNIYVGKTSTYTANGSADVLMKAGNNIYLKNCWIKTGSKIHALIQSDICPDLTLDEEHGDNQLINTQNLGRFSNSDLSEIRNTEDFAISPNPNQGIFTIQSLSEIKMTKVTITRLDNSKQVFLKNDKGTQTFEVDISKEPTGLYTVQVFFDNNKSDSKTIIRQ